MVNEPPSIYSSSASSNYSDVISNTELSTAVHSRADSMSETRSYVSSFASIASSVNSGNSATDFIAAKVANELDDGKSFFRQQIFIIVTSKIFNNIMLLIILINTVTMTFQAIKSINSKYSWYLDIIDQIFLVIYIWECSLKLYAWRLYYFKSWWNIFDFFIVSISIVTWFLPEILTSSANFDAKFLRVLRVMRAFRAIRSIRVLRAINFLRSLQIVVSLLIRSIPAMANIIFLAFIVIYIFMIIGTASFGKYDDKHFGSLFKTLFRLIQLMTLDDWSVIYEDNKKQIPIIWFYLAIFIIIETFIFLNLFVAVIVSNLQSSKSHKIRRRRIKQKINEDYLINNDNVPYKKKDKLDDRKFGLDDNTDEDFKSQIGKYYGETLPERQQLLLSKYFMLLVALEYNNCSYQKQQKFWMI